MSVAVIRTWNELRKEEAEAKWAARLEKRGGKPKPKKKKGKKNTTEAEAEKKEAELEEVVVAGAVEETTEPVAGPSSGAGVSKFKAPSINILEALAATGLRSIRYAKEIPNVKYVLANDLSPSACEAMRRNVQYNGVGLDYDPAKNEEQEEGQDKVEEKTEQKLEEKAEAEAAKVEEAIVIDEPSKTESAEVSSKPAAPQPEPRDPVGRRPNCRGKVKINEGDACAFMYNHRAAVGPTSRVDVVDLDPYGTAAPFLDAAIGCIADGGLLAITCTDLAVLAGQQYPEKCYSNYGGTNVHAEFTHEAALRLVMHSLQQTAARYGRYVTPMLSFSIDFYVRLFVRVHTGPEQVKQFASQTGVVYTCQFCQTPVTQPFGKVIVKKSQKGAEMNSFKTIAGPTASHGSSCEECSGTMHIGGPLWLGPLQDNAFANRVLREIESTQADYKTYNRMHGMLSLAAQELPDLWFFTANRIAKSVNMSSLPLTKVLSALLNGGWKVSRSHCAPGAVKTNAPRSFLYDMMREEAKTVPVKLSNVAEGSPTRVLLAKPMTHEINFEPHPDASLDRQGKETFYQINPLPNWGPAPRAKSIYEHGANGKRKAAEQEGEEVVQEEEGSAGKKAKVGVEVDVAEEDMMNA